jgi:thiamine pyrophosphate-dependent acetolactate synthase large subunit-like protein
MHKLTHRFNRFRQFMTHVGLTSASMGYGMPAAIAMQRPHPERLVLSVNGAGDFLMSGQEIISPGRRFIAIKQTITMISGREA